MFVFGIGITLPNMVTRMLQLSLLPSSVVAVNVTVVIPTGNSKLIS